MPLSGDIGVFFKATSQEALLLRGVGSNIKSKRIT